MIPPKPWLLPNSKLVNVVTVLNLCYSGKTIRISKFWYRELIRQNLLDDCFFTIEISTHNFTPFFELVNADSE